MELLQLFVTASIPVLKVLLITALGSYLALDRVDILGEVTRKNLNTVVFYVFSPALVGSNLAKTITYQSMVKMWFMPVNILITFIIGSVLGWILIQLTRPPAHLRGLVLGCCAAGNLGNLLLIIVPAVCKEKGSPFGAPDVCHTYAMAYASLSMAFSLPPAMNIGTMTQLFGAGENECSVIMLWTYAFASLSLTFWSAVFMWLVTRL